jgi:hypothetical protein
MTTLMLLVVLAALPAQNQETRTVPADSVEIRTRGCLKGRVFTATPRPADEGVVLGPDVTGWNFRVAGSRAVLDSVKKNNGMLVEVVGLVKQSAFTRPGPGTGSRVTVVAPPMDTMQRGVQSTAPEGIAVIDVTSIRPLSDVCPIK